MRKWITILPTSASDEVHVPTPHFKCDKCGNYAPAVGIERFCLASADSDDYCLQQALWAECKVCEERFCVGVEWGPGDHLNPGEPVPFEPCRIRCR